MEATDPYPAWREYEDLVFEALSMENLDIVFSRNATLPGLTSGANRQIGILSSGNVGGHDVLVIIDCKHHGSKLDVNDVGRFSTPAAHSSGEGDEKATCATRKNGTKDHPRMDRCS